MANDKQSDGNAAEAYNKMRLSLDLMKRFEEGNSKASGIWGLSLFSENLVKDKIPASAGCDDHVLITGETGTGKKLVAREIARQAGKPADIIHVDCEAIPESRVESDLFGHVNEALASASGNKEGYVQQANNGILLLDKIETLPPHVQAKILHTMQTGKVVRPGTGKSEEVRVRVIATTSRPHELLPNIQLYFQRRLQMPPLRERFSDLFAVLCLLLRKAKDDGKLGKNAYWVFPPIVIVRILYSPWAGNFLELKNAANVSIDNYSQLEEKRDAVLFEFNLPTEEIPEFRDPKLVSLLWSDFEKAVKYHPDHAKYVNTPDWARFSGWGCRLPEQSWPSASVMPGAGTYRQGRLVRFCEAPQNALPGSSVTGKNPAHGLTIEKGAPSTVECLSFGQFAVCYALTAAYWREQKVLSYPPFLSMSSLEDVRKFMTLLDRVFQKIYELPKKESPPGTRAKVEGEAASPQSEPPSQGVAADSPEKTETKATELPPESAGDKQGADKDAAHEPQRSQPDSGTGFFSAHDLAEMYDIATHGKEYHAFEERLRRWRKKNSLGTAWKAESDPQRHEAKYIYRESAVRHLIKKNKKQRKPRTPTLSRLNSDSRET